MRKWMTAVAVASIAVVAAACSTSQPVSGVSSSSASSAPAGGAVTFAEAANTPAYYIFPLTPLTNYNGSNDSQFLNLIYRPLYWISNGTQVVADDSISLAAQPTYTDGGRTAVINLKNYKWSDGTPVTARDVTFWMNLLDVAKNNWAGYVPGEFPDNLTNVTAVNSTTVDFTFNRVYNPQWILYNELSQITPIPQHVWDRTSLTGKVGDYDLTPAGAKKVYNFLLAQANDAATYTTSPLWKVVDGPFQLSKFANGNDVTMVPNPAYSGPVKATVSSVHLEPFTSDTAEYNVLLAGGVDYGYVPPEDAKTVSLLQAKGYTVTPADYWAVNFTVMNFHNAAAGPIFGQLYVRQALESLIDQQGWIKGAYLGYGSPTYGPVPLTPSNPFVSAMTQKAVYPFSVTHATALLAAHGWKVTPNGVTTCASPGSGLGHCGAGIPAGAQMSFKLEYPSGLAALDRAMQAEQSNFSLAGIKLNLTPEPLDTVNSHEQICTSSQSTCNWQLVQGDLAWTYQPDYYPEGASIFATGASSNAGSYSDHVADALIRATHQSTSPTALTAYQNYLAVQLPVLWTPKQQMLVAVRNNLGGTLPTDPFGNLFAENWRWK
jgi:peptide/nickel transport system substrate-binding protein